jgi:hypothetical protein
MYFVKSLVLHAMLQPLGRNQLATDPGKVLNVFLKQEESRFHSRVILHDSEAVLCQRYSTSALPCHSQSVKLVSCGLSHVLIKPKY